MVAFNHLVPALILNLTVQSVIPIGSNNISTGGRLILGPIVNGTLESEPGFETQINATFSNADDWPTVDPDGKHERPDLRGLIKTDDDEYLQILAKGIQTIIPELTQIITGEKELSLPFGAFQSVILVSFRTGTSKYKNLEDGIFVGSETVKSLGERAFKAGVRISKLYSSKTNITL
ncbi:MAG: hypothetical protein HETSPECPRED_009715 [Heterodermia speciosa]|uniref:Uncharacterized protein n=1 Tax=Heterodermia speciosa TaxID=116794 RepID=A0A8H3G290_9LECA|nr:MAG: hypothetical protein HETSPECPRED_009715 [Heterodermia speciosa]